MTVKEAREVLDIDAAKIILREVWNIKSPTDNDIKYYRDNISSYQKQYLRFNKYRNDKTTGNRLS